MVYTNDVELLKKHLGAAGAFREWVSSDRRAPLPSYVTAEEYATHREIFSRPNGTYTPTLNWYRCMLRDYNLTDDETIPKERLTTTQPLLFVGSLMDPIGNAAMHEDMTKVFAKEAKIRNLEAGHWIQLEKPDELNLELQEFFKEVLDGENETV